ncbi:MAG: sensor histidine kinase [Stenotrophomonas sp.]
MDAALVDIDAILATFSALLRIAQIEGGKRRANFAAIDLAEVIDTVAEIYQPAIEDRGQTLTLLAAAPVRIAGDRELLTQMVANLVENATRHSPPGATIILEAMHRGERACLVVADTGPGIPHDAHAAVLTRFYRLDVSRSTPGNGLGLSLVKAVAELHGATMELGDNHPGLRVTLDFPPTPSQR